MKQGTEDGIKDAETRMPTLKKVKKGVATP
jgi:hypothetical protein